MSTRFMPQKHPALKVSDSGSSAVFPGLLKCMSLKHSLNTKIFTVAKSVMVQPVRSLIFMEVFLIRRKTLGMNLIRHGESNPIINPI